MTMFMNYQKKVQQLNAIRILQRSCAVYLKLNYEHTYICL